MLVVLPTPPPPSSCWWWCCGVPPRVDASSPLPPPPPPRADVGDVLPPPRILYSLCCIEKDRGIIINESCENVFSNLIRLIEMIKLDGNTISVLDLLITEMSSY